MFSVRAGKMCILSCLCMIASLAASGATVCAMDSSNETVVLRTNSDFTDGAIVALNGWLSNGTTIFPMHGTAVVSADGTSLKVSIQGINNVRHQHLGVVWDADLMLNETGSFENVNAGRPFTYEIIPVTWTALDSCPSAPPFTPGRQ